LMLTVRKSMLKRVLPEVLGTVECMLDSHPIGTSLRDFMRGSDLSRVPEDIAAAYDNADVDAGVKVYRPEVVGAR